MTFKYLKFIPLSEGHKINIQSTLREALYNLNKAQPKICIVINNKGILERTITDGDLRRSLLDGLSLEATINELPIQSPVVCFESDPDQKIHELMRSKGVSTTVVLDSLGYPIGFKKDQKDPNTILLSPPHLGNNEVKFVKKAFASNWIAPIGPNLESFEKKLGEISGRDEVVAVSSGTAGIHLALLALDLPEGSPVYVSDKTFAASLQPILYERMVPILIDCEPVSWNMSPAALKRRLARDNLNDSLPGAIVVVHLYGQSAQMDKIMPLAEQYGIPVIEDAAESLGASYMGKPSGSHGLISVYSFNGNKIITTSSGGAVLTDNNEIANRIRYLSTQGRDPYQHYQHSQIAFNYRMSNILAGIGLGQLEVLSERVERRRAIHERYRQDLSHISGIGFQDEIDGSLSNRWLTVITLDPDQIMISPSHLSRLLKKLGIETRPSWKPMHMQPLCYNFDFEMHSKDEAISTKLFLQALCLPSGSNLSDEQLEKIVSSLENCLLSVSN